MGDSIGIAIAYLLCALFGALLVAAFPFAILWLWLNGELAVSGAVEK